MQLLETIKIEEGEICNISYHQERFDRSRNTLFGIHEPLILSNIIKAPPHGLHRCRIVYSDSIHSIEYLPYHAKEISTLVIVASDIEYTFKYENREELDTLLSNAAHADEIIIEKEGYLTDTTIANIAFYDGKKWMTPSEPLLKGTMRAKLLNEKFLTKTKIKKEDLACYTHVALMNAMIGFKVLNINPTQIC